jgi:hypothetical protein
MGDKLPDHKDFVTSELDLLGSRLARLRPELRTEVSRLASLLLLLLAAAASPDKYLYRCTVWHVEMLGGPVPEGESHTAPR